MFDKHELGQFLCVRTTFPVICSLCCRFCQVCTCEFISVWCKSGWQPWSEVDTVIVRVPCPSCVSKWSWTSLRNRSFKSMHLTTLLIRARLCYPSASVVAELSRKSQAQHRLLNENIRRCVENTLNRHLESGVHTVGVVAWLKVISSQSNESSLCKPQTILPSYRIFS